MIDNWVEKNIKRKGWRAENIRFFSSLLFPFFLNYPCFFVFLPYLSHPCAPENRIKSYYRSQKPNNVERKRMANMYALYLLTYSYLAHFQDENQGQKSFQCIFKVTSDMMSLLKNCIQYQQLVTTWIFFS